MARKVKSQTEDTNIPQVSTEHVTQDEDIVDVSSKKEESAIPTVENTIEDSVEKITRKQVTVKKIKPKFLI